ncbi:MAG: proton-conducting transporter membrane subunit, partial [Thiotrichaceae bacterium]
MSDDTHTGRNSSSSNLVWLWLALLPFSLFIALVWGLSQYSLPWQFNLPWVPSLDIALAFRIDGLSAQMLALITGIGTMIFVYAVGYLDHEPRRAQIFTVLPLFMLAMIGAVSADDVVVLFLFWELTSITSFLLVGFNHTQVAARDSARQALLITMGGGLALLGGLLLLSQIADTRLLSEIIAAAPQLRDDPRLPYAIMLVLIGAFTKSAQFPFHFWLPNAMSAPTPVSAYLHSATMVKLGIYLMARLDPAFNDWLLWEVT